MTITRPGDFGTYIDLGHFHCEESRGPEPLGTSAFATLCLADGRVRAKIVGAATFVEAMYSGLHIGDVRGP